MPSGQLGLMLRRLIGRPRPADLGDGELLEQFAARGDMSAFEALVQRYGPLVLGVCRRVLQDEHEAEDAFQATFLVFARRAATIRSQGAVGSWLAGTAYRISLKAKGAALRRRIQEREAGTQLPRQSEADEAWDELRLVLDEELQRLPEKYRVPLVLCYLEGKTNEVAARELGWAPGSMSYRLAQARERLRERLVHRGVGLAPALLAPVLTAHALVDVPTALSTATAKGAWLYSTGQAVAGLLSPHAVALGEGILRAAEWVRMALVTLFALLSAVLIYVAGTLWTGGLAEEGSPYVDADSFGPFVKPLDNDNRIAIGFARDTQRFGIACTRLRDPKAPPQFKLLTRYADGRTNNVCIRLDGEDYIFGREVPNARWLRDRNRKLWKEVKVGERKWVSIMEWKREQVRVTQTVEIVVGEQTHLYDTALVKYIVENRDGKAHSVGLRSLVDTYIGANDGVPFLIPPKEGGPSGQLVDTLAVFEAGTVPEFLRALESSDLSDRNATVAEMGLRLKGMESLHKLVICRWPQEHGTSEARWDWEYQPMNAGPEKDSCVVLYWDARDLKAGEKRAMGYTYGLGRIADEAEQAPMRLLAGGAAKTGRPFVLSFYIQGGKVGSKVKLRLPAGLALADGEKEEKIIQAHNIKDYAQVSWRVLAARVGRYTVKAVLDERETQQEVHVRESSIFD